MKKIVVGLFGIHYLKNLNHWMNNQTNPNYLNTYENNRKFLYDDLVKDGSTIDFYSATYYSDKLQDLIKDYNFKGLSIQHMDNNLSGDLHKSFYKRNNIFKKTVRTILDSEIKDYDLVIITRYDINLMQSVMTLNIDYDKINMFYRSKWGDNHNMCDDNFYMMPYSKLQYFYDCISKADEFKTSHDYLLHIDPECINYMIDGAYYSHESKMYSIHRGFKD
jgi:hypothetical protein